MKTLILKKKKKVRHAKKHYQNVLELSGRIEHDLLPSEHTTIKKYLRARYPEIGWDFEEPDKFGHTGVWVTIIFPDGLLA